MDGEWRTVQDLQSDEILLVEDGNHGENRPRSDEFGTKGTAFVRAADLEGGRIKFSECEKINEVAFSRIRKGIGCPHDIILSHKGTVGKLARAGSDSPPFVCSPQTTFWRVVNNGSLDRDFLYAFMRSSNFRGQLNAVKGETDMAPYVSLTAQRRLLIPTPKLAVQQGIGRLLGVLDDKIELNRRMAETLEATARALFKSWFVDFDPVHTKAQGRPISLPDEVAGLFPNSYDPLGYPSGWRLEPLLDHARLISGGTPKTDEPSYWGGTIQWASAKDVSQCSGLFLGETERMITEKGLRESSTKIIPALSTVVVARGATTGRSRIVAHAMAMNQTCYALSSAHGLPFWLSCSFHQAVAGLVKAAHGSVFETITTSTLRYASIIAAPRPITGTFEQLVTPLFMGVLARTQEAATTAALRDTLLPKLISGELHIRDAERAVAAA